MQYQLDMIGYDAILIRFIDVDNKQLLPTIYALNQLLKSDSNLNIIDITPSYQTLLITFNIQKINYFQLSNIINKHIKLLLKKRASSAHDNTHLMSDNLITIPVCYDESLAPDLYALSQYSELSVDNIIHLHTATIYSCYAIGFMPNFAYLGNVDKQIQMPRHSNPRSRVAAGSVGIADNQTAIYPKASPGGWQIIGQSPAQLDILSVGCNVKFHAISLDEFNHAKEVDVL